MSETLNSAPARGFGVKLAVGGIVVAVCIAGLIFVTQGSLDYFNSVAEFVESLDTYKGGVVRLRGIVQKEGITQDEKNLDIEFDIVEEGATLRVHYRGVRPSNFQPGTDIIVTGKYDVAAKIFEASELSFKCPSKYEGNRQTN